MISGSSLNLVAASVAGAAPSTASTSPPAMWWTPPRIAGQRPI